MVTCAPCRASPVSDKNTLPEILFWAFSANEGRRNTIEIYKIRFFMVITVRIVRPDQRGQSLADTGNVQ